MFKGNQHRSGGRRGNNGGYNRGGNAQRGNNSYRSNSGGYQQEKINFRTNCHDCGNDCTVPFKPNGRKPVLCSDCFRGNEGHNERSSQSYNRNDRQSFNRSSERRERKPRPNIGPTLKEEIASINQKLERILTLIEREPVTHTIKKTSSPGEIELADILDSIDQA